MDEDDDDLYDPTVPATTAAAPKPSDGAGQMDMEDGVEVIEEEIEVDDEDDFNIITEAPEGAEASIPPPRHAALRNEPLRPSSAEIATPPKPTPLSIAHPKAETPLLAPAAAAKPAVPQKPGSAYPAQHTSTIAVNANPIHPVTGKPILSTDLDVDFPSDDKPWRRPGSDISDYFNYGFDEFTWASYCLKQQEVRKEVGDQKRQLEDMQTFLGMPGGPMPGMSGPPTSSGPGPSTPSMGPGGGPPGPQAGAGPPNAIPGMPGMPDMSQDMMQGMLAGMMAQGLDPASMDPMTFMQHAQAMMGGGQPGPGGPPGGQPGFGGPPPGQPFGVQGGGQPPMGYGGYNQQNQGFRPGVPGKGPRRW
ncbi:hypothetical protein AJ80_04950 [Polytolypa hystricis UAMH7299]|uniref:Pre-mRNA polyadenylation factor Fip1 domain-containing protein n=1 Tax=Polytolypa hystricis (strain UAMH7299) TaxID=1447883 RepID=A0A2B7Y8Y9_POLH7|nr:hypothetical protein AJ80_04950 [Polytolypa hystricis UAMH7299]